MSDTDPARRTIAAILAVDDRGSELLGQLEHAGLGVSAEEVRIRPADSALPIEVDDGPLEVTAHVTATDGEHLGEILVWVQVGRLAPAEYAWVTDDPHGAWPDPERVTLAASR